MARALICLLFLGSGVAFAEEATPVQPSASTAATPEEEEEKPAAEQKVELDSRAKERFLVEVNGYRDYNHLATFRKKFRKRLPIGTEIVDRRISRGTVLWAIFSAARMDEAKQVLGELEAIDNRLTYKEVDSDFLKVTLR